MLEWRCVLVNLLRVRVEVRLVSIGRGRLAQKWIVCIKRLTCVRVRLERLAEIEFIFLVGRLVRRIVISGHLQPTCVSAARPLPLSGVSVIG